MELSDEVKRKQEEILSLDGKNFGDKVRNYILIVYYGMENYKKRGIIKLLKEDGNMLDKTSTKMQNGKGLSKETLLIIAIGVNLKFIDALAIFDLYGYSLKGPNEEKIWKKLICLNNEKFRALSRDERIEALDLDRLCDF